MSPETIIGAASPVGVGGQELDSTVRTKEIEALTAAAEQEAKARGACKLTLEVLSGNAGAYRLYQRLGFANYQLDPAMGQAQFMQKWLD